MFETEKVTFTGADGQTLAAAIERPRGRTRGVALFAHCFSCSKDFAASRHIARTLAGRGLAVMRFDFTGLGNSDGDFANTNFSSNLEDLVAASEFLREREGAPSLLVGHSLGGAAVIAAAGRIPEAKAVAVIAAPADAEHVVHQFADRRAEIESQGEAVVSLAGRPFRIRRQFLADVAGHNVEKAAADLKRALLVLHSPLDQVVGVENATRLFTAAKHPKSYVSLGEADHLLTRKADAAYAAEVLAAWAGRYLDASDRPDGPAEEAGGAVSRSRRGARFAQDVRADGHALIIDVDPAEGGAGLGPNPTRVVEAALAACSAITAQMYAARKDLPLEGVEVRVRRAAGEDAHAARRWEKSVELEGPLDAGQRARILEIIERCPVQRLLAERVEVEATLLD